MKKVMFLALALMISSSAIFASTAVTMPCSVKQISGNCKVCPPNLLTSKKEAMKMEVMKIYSCSKHPDCVSDRPGSCPKCHKKMIGKKVKDQKKN